MKRKKLFQVERLASYDYIVTKEQPLSYTSEAFQKALINIEFVNVDGSYKVLQFTSSLAGAGKTTFVSNFAYLMSKKGKKVIIVDLDLRKPKINRVFKAPNEDGITEFLLGTIEEKALIKYHEELGISYIPAGARTDAVTSILESKKLHDLIASLKERFDYVILDSPPVLAVSDALFIAKIADGIVFVVAQNEAKKTLINEAINTLKQNHFKVLGVVLTQVDIKEENHYSYSYAYEYTKNKK